MAVRNNDVLAAYQAQVYVDGKPYAGKFQRVTHNRTTATADVTTLSDRVAKAIPTLSRHEFSFTKFDSAGAEPDEIQNLVDIDENDLVPLIFAHTGDVVVGEDVNVVWAIGSSQHTSINVGDVIRSTFTTRTGQPPTKGELTALAGCEDDDKIWSETPSTAQTITMTFAETQKNTTFTEQANTADQTNGDANALVFFVRSGDTAGRVGEGQWKLQSRRNSTLWKDIISWSPIEANTNYIAYTEEVNNQMNTANPPVRTSDTPIRLNLKKTAYTDPTPSNADDNPDAFSTEWSVAYIRVL